MEKPTFAAVLDSAIVESGLSLDGVRRHLAGQGVTVSRAILSYWRRGQALPERANSLVAIEALERIFDLPTHSLTGLLGSRAPRTPWVAGSRSALARGRLWPGSTSLCAELQAPPDGQLRYWSIHDQMLLDNDGQERLLRVRMVAQAAMDGVRRAMMYYHSPDAERGSPEVHAVRSARLARTRVDNERGLHIAELMLARSLTCGDVTAFEYDLRMPDGDRLDFFHRRFTRSVRQYVCQVQFGGRVPARVRQYYQRTQDSPHRNTKALSVGWSGAVTLAVEDVPPGIVGVEWEW